MVWHEIAGIFALAITGGVLVAALSPKAGTSGVIQSSFQGASGLISAINAPVS